MNALIIACTALYLLELPSVKPFDRLQPAIAITYVSPNVVLNRESQLIHSHFFLPSAPRMQFMVMGGWSGAVSGLAATVSVQS